MKVLIHFLTKDNYLFLIVYSSIIGIIFAPWIAGILSHFFEIGLFPIETKNHSILCSNENLLKMTLGCYLCGFINLFIVFIICAVISFVLFLIILFILWNYDEYQKSKKKLSEKN